MIVPIYAVLYIFKYTSFLSRLAISTKREYLADAGAVEITKNSRALASALRKISKDPYIEAIKREDIAQLFIENPSSSGNNEWNKLFKFFDTHPPIRKRIRILDQF